MLIVEGLNVRFRHGTRSGIDVLLDDWSGFRRGFYFCVFLFRINGGGAPKSAGQ
jgi:hypothetical protein